MECFFFQAEDGIRDAQESRGLGDVYKRQIVVRLTPPESVVASTLALATGSAFGPVTRPRITSCLLYTSDAADDLPCVDLGGRRITKKKKHNNTASKCSRPPGNPRTIAD